MAKRGNRYHDLSRLFMQMELLAAKPQFRTAVLGGVTRALLRGFDPELSAARPMFRLLLLMHRVNHLATLTLTAERFPASVHSRRVRRQHRDWLEAELAGAAVAREIA